jgi:hypothetical protein
MLPPQGKTRRHLEESPLGNSLGSFLQPFTATKNTRETATFYFMNNFNS